MFSRHFGQFLLQEGIVTPQTLSRALARLSDARPLVGILALARGYMTPDQVREVNRIQKREDKRFGQISIEKGYLTAEKLEELLSAQKNEHVLLGQILVEDRILSHEGLLRALELYREKPAFLRKAAGAMTAHTDRQWIGPRRTARRKILVRGGRNSSSDRQRYRSHRASTWPKEAADSPAAPAEGRQEIVFISAEEPFWLTARILRSRFGALARCPEAVRKFNAATASSGQLLGQRDRTISFPGRGAGK